MAFVELNGALIFYSHYDSPHSERRPIVLIHGSTQSGASDWGFLAPLLAREYPVVVPDCRGHGLSGNPRNSYSFKEMAADTAGLVRALGYDRAHIIGHSNGGNVALVTLLEHPEVVQTAVLQAANAFISADLLEREKSVFDPERVARSDPDWVAGMVARHGPTYWRELLQLTQHETVSEPTYSSADLARVQRPALVIQGENDQANAPGRHGQFIARNIPHAEMWIPAGIGHNVHFESPLEWQKHVLDFLDRRGDDDNEALFRLGQARYRDSRETVFDVRASGAPAAVTLSGTVLTEEQRQAAAAALPAGEAVSTTGLRVLLTEATPRALVNRPVADLRREPRSMSERVNQALLGDVVRVLEQHDDWARVRLQETGYLGWIDSRALYAGRGEADVAAYRAATDRVVVAPSAAVYLSPPPEGQMVTRLPFGAKVAARSGEGHWMRFRMPDGTDAWAAQADLLPLAELPRPDAGGIARALEVFKGFAGTPYLWGGRTPFGFDCSGFAQAFWGFLGVSIPRDADQQFAAGIPVAGSAQPGDLLFFGGEDGEAHRSISHVAVSLGNSDVIHANGATASVACNSLDPDRPLYRAWLREHLAGVRRFA